MSETYNCNDPNYVPMCLRKSASAGTGSRAPALTSMQQFQLNLAGQVGTAIGTAVGKSLFGPSQPNPAQEQAAAQAAEQARLADKQRTTAMLQQQELAKQRILGSLKDSNPSATLTLKTDDDSPQLALNTGDEASAPVVVHGNQTHYFGIGTAKCPPSQDASVVDLCSPRDTPPPATAALAIKIDPDVLQGGGGGLTTGPADSAIHSTPTQTGTLVAAPGAGRPTAADAMEQQEPAVTPVAMAKFVPLLRQPSFAAGGPLPGANRPAICESLSGELNATQQVARRAVLAKDVYERYAPDGRTDLPVIAGFDRISDDSAQMNMLLPGIADRSLLDPADSDYRAAIYRDRGDPTKIFLVFRGTKTLGDWINANGPQAAGLRSDYYAKAIALTKVLNKNANAQGLQLELLGHSLGGGMADAASVANQVPATSFNPSGVNPQTLPAGIDISQAPHYATDYVVNGEPLNSHQDNLGLTRTEISVATGLAGSAAIPAGIAVAGAADVVNDGSTKYTKQGIEVLGALYSAPLPAAIGLRVTLAPDPADVSPLAPFQLHYMSSVLDAIVAHSHELYGQYVFNGCGT